MALTFTQAELDELKAAALALAKGNRVASVTINGNSTTYSAANMDDLFAMIALAEASVAAADTTDPRPSSFVVSSSKGAW